jgi:hypothetical protein
MIISVPRNTSRGEALTLASLGAREKSKSLERSSGKCVTEQGDGETAASPGSGPARKKLAASWRGLGSRSQ